MRSRRVPFALFCALMAMLVVTSPGHAKDPVLVTLATWQKGGKEPMLVIRLTEQLSKRQKDLITSGFTTHSELSVTLAAGNEAPDLTLSDGQCTVKFDTWEEIYDIARIEKTMQLLTAKNFAAYAEACLTARISASQLSKIAMGSARALHATLKVHQITTEKAAKIREWLINQQSGVMQGLFSHMLGELKLSEEIDVIVQIPPLTADIESNKAIGMAPRNHPVER